MISPAPFPHPKAIGFPKEVVVVGIDTDAGKTLVSALFCLGLDAGYWKPVQAGTTPHTDTEWVRTVSGLTHSHFYPEAYLLKTPASPHHAAEIDGVTIEEGKLQPPAHPGILLIEGAGGLMVPLRRDFHYLDLLERWKLPVILVVRTYLGSINHSLLSLEALQRRGIPLLGLVFNDGGRPESEAVIADYAQAPVLGRVPQLAEVNRETLLRLWEEEFAGTVSRIGMDGDA